MTPRPGPSRVKSAPPARTARESGIEEFAALIEPHRRFFEVAACCHDLNDARSAGGGAADWLGDPMEIALVQLAADAMPALPHSSRVEEIGLRQLLINGEPTR